MNFLLEDDKVFEIDDPAEFVQPVEKPPVAAIRKAPRWIIGSVVGVLLLLLLSISIAGFTGLFSVRVVLTGSMAPTIKPGDAIVTVSDTLRDPQKGDIVVYTGRRLDGTPVAPFAHRIIGGSAQDGWIVKGDANPEPDTQHPKAADIESVVIGTIPVIGRFFNVQMLVMLVALVFGIWLIVDGVRDKS